MIPEYDSNGNLPPGIHTTSWREFIHRFAISDRRKRLAEGLYRALSNLKAAGCATAYSNGSFVTNKAVPDDFDACWDTNGVDVTQVDSVLLDFSNKRAFQKAKFGGELFPNIREATSYLYFIEFFQRTKSDNSPKGIVQIDLRKLP